MIFTNAIITVHNLLVDINKARLLSSRCYKDELYGILQILILWDSIKEVTVAVISAKGISISFLRFVRFWKNCEVEKFRNAFEKEFAFVTSSSHCTLRAPYKVVGKLFNKVWQQWLTVDMTVSPRISVSSMVLSWNYTVGMCVVGVFLWSINLIHQHVPSKPWKQDKHITASCGPSFSRTDGVSRVFLNV